MLTARSHRTYGPLSKSGGNATAIELSLSPVPGHTTDTPRSDAECTHLRYHLAHPNPFLYETCHGTALHTTLGHQRMLLAKSYLRALFNPPEAASGGRRELTESDNSHISVLRLDRISRHRAGPIDRPRPPDAGLVVRPEDLPVADLAAHPLDVQRKAFTESDDRSSDNTARPHDEDIHTVQHRVLIKRLRILTVSFGWKVHRARKRSGD